MSSIQLNPAEFHFEIASPDSLRIRHLVCGDMKADVGSLEDVMQWALTHTCDGEPRALNLNVTMNTTGARRPLGDDVRDVLGLVTATATAMAAQEREDPEADYILEVVGEIGTGLHSKTNPHQMVGAFLVVIAAFIAEASKAGGEPSAEIVQRVALDMAAKFPDDPDKADTP